MTNNNDIMKILELSQKEIQKTHTLYKWFITCATILIGIGLCFGGYLYGKTFNETKNEINRFTEQLKIDYKTQVEILAKNQTDDIINKIVEDKVNKRIEVYNTIMLSLSYDRASFQKLNDLANSNEKDINVIAQKTRENILSIIKLDKFVGNVYLIKDGKSIDLKKLKKDEIILFLNDNDIYTRLIVAKYIFVSMGSISLNNNINKSDILTILKNKIIDEKDMRVLAYINRSLNLLTEMNIELENIDEWENIDFNNLNIK